MCSFDIVHNRDLADQYLNVHSRAFTQLFGYNNNIQFGDQCQLYYCTLYDTKSNQKDDSREFRFVCDVITRRLKKILEHIENGGDNDNKQMNGQDKNDFIIGMGHVLSGIRAHMAENVISAPLAAYLTIEAGCFVLLLLDCPELSLYQ